MSVIGLGGSGAALCGNEAETLELTGKLPQSLGLIPGEDERRFDGLESGAGGQASAGSRILGKLELCARGVGGDVLRGGLRLGMNDVLDRSHAADGFFCENAQLEGQSAGKSAFEINRAAAHASDNAGMLNFGPFELDKNDGLSGSKEIGHDADDFQVELFDLVAGEDGVGVALHAWSNLAKWNDFRGGGSLSPGRQEHRCDRRSKSNCHS